MQVAIIGLGYVGLPRALQFCEKKVKVIGLDVDEKKIKDLNNKKSYITNISSKKIKKAIEKKFLIASSDFSLIKKANVIILCLPTPLKKNLNPDLSYIKKTFSKIRKYLKKKQLLCLESTSYPGTTREVFYSYLNQKFKLGKNFYLGYSPERNDPGLTNLNINLIPKIVSGLTNNCANFTKRIYQIIFKRTISVSSIEMAEMTKIYENIYRAVNIGFVNEMKKISFKMNLDIDEIIAAAKTKPFGFKAFYPGPGLGGHCIPIDPFYLSWKAKQSGIKTEFINLAGKVNRSMPYWVVKQLISRLKKKQNKVLILGIAYKKDINDCRESPAFSIINILKQKKNFSISYSDPYIKKIPKLRDYNFSNMRSVKINSNELKKYDAVVLVTDHQKFNYRLIEKNSKLIIDARHKFNKKLDKVFYS